MSLSSEDKHRIIFALCHIGSVLDSTSVNYNSIINDRLTGLNSYVEDYALKLVVEIETMKAKLTSTSQKGSVKQIGDIVMDTEIGDRLLKKEYRRLTDELAHLLDIPNRCSSGSMVGCVWV